MAGMAPTAALSGLCESCSELSLHARSAEETDFNYRSKNGSSEAFGALTGTGSFTRKGEVLRALAHGLRDCPGAALPSNTFCHRRVDTRRREAHVR